MKPNQMRWLIAGIFVEGILGCVQIAVLWSMSFFLAELNFPLLVDVFVCGIVVVAWLMLVWVLTSLLVDEMKKQEKK